MKKQQFLQRISLFLIIATVSCFTAVFPKEFKHAKISWKGKMIEALTNEIGIKLKKDAKLSKLQERLELLGFSLVNQVDDLGHAKIKIPESYGIPKAAEDLINSNLVEIAEPIVLTRICRSPNDPFFPSQWGLTKINANSAWDITTGSSSVTIGVLDSGIPILNGVLSHYDLQNTNRITLGGDFIQDGESVRDLNGHGTHVAGILSAESDNSNGIAGTSWNTKLYIVQVFDDDGNGDSYTLYEGFKDAIDNGAVKIINFSGGSPEENYWLEQGIIYARDHNVLVVAAAGNINDVNNPNGIVVWPGAYSTSYDNLIAVSATTSTDGLAI
jgi:subtilisin family serine protease